MSPQPSPRLFIGGLKRNVEKEELMEEFKEFGEIVDLWVAYDPPGFAFMQYANKESAKAAAEAKDKTVMFGNEVRVEFTQKRGGLKEDGQSTITCKPRIFIGNIIEQINVLSLNSAFEKFGQITDIHINNIDGFAFIGFETAESAERALEETNGTEIFGGLVKTVLTYKRDNSPPEKEIANRERMDAKAEVLGPSSRIFIGELSREVTKDELEAVFTEYGEIKEIWIPYSFKGFAKYCFIEYETAESAQMAVDEMHGTEHEFSKELKVEMTAHAKKPEKPKSDPITVPRLFIGGIKEKVDKSTFRAVFEPFGVITDVWIAFNPPGFAFVEYEDMESASEAILALDGESMFGGKLNVALTDKKSPGSKKYPQSFGPRVHPYGMPARDRARGRGRGGAPRRPRGRSYPRRYEPSYDYYDGSYDGSYDGYHQGYGGYEAGFGDPYGYPDDPYYYPDPNYNKPDPLNIRSAPTVRATRGRGRGRSGNFY